MITIDEKNRGRTGSVGSRQVEYILVGTEDDAEMGDADVIQHTIASVPHSIEDGNGGTLYIGDVTLDDLIITPTKSIALVTVPYTQPESGSAIGQSGIEATYEFAYQAPSFHAYYALEQRSYPEEAPDYGLKLNVTPDGEHQGLPLPSGNTTNIWRFSAERSFMTTQYEALVESMVGATNSESFKSRPAGSMRLVGVQSSITSRGNLNITFGFQYAANRSDLTISGITGVDINGHELWWALDEKETDLTNGKVILKPRAIYVARVFPEANFNELGF